MFGSKFHLSWRVCMCFIAAMYSGALLSNDLPRDSNEWDAKESKNSLWFANTSHTSQ